MIKKGFFLLVVLWVCSASAVLAQFGGRKDDVVLYMLTSKGSADFQVVPFNTVNDTQSIARFRIVHTNTVPIQPADPFPLKRQVFYEEEDELFQLGTDEETTIGLHRIFLAPSKIFVIEGLNNPFGPLLGTVANYIAFPKDIDLRADLALETLKVLTWVPRKWPFMVLTDKRGPLGPPNISGFEYLFQTPGLVKIPFFIPWTSFRSIYQGVGWQSGIDIKVLEIDPVAGNTTRLVRLRPGKRTPFFRIPGNTHLFVLQGSVEIAPANTGATQLVKNHYAFIPRNFTIRLSNPKKYDGPIAP